MSYPFTAPRAASFASWSRRWRMNIFRCRAQLMTRWRSGIGFIQAGYFAG